MAIINGIHSIKFYYGVVIYILSSGIVGVAYAWIDVSSCRKKRLEKENLNIEQNIEVGGIPSARINDNQLNEITTDKLSMKLNGIESSLDSKIKKEKSKEEQEKTIINDIKKYPPSDELSPYKAFDRVLNYCPIP